MDTIIPPQIQPRRLCRSSDDSVSCVQRRGIARGVVVEFSKDGLSLAAIKPSGKCCRSLRIRSAFYHRGVVDERLRRVGLAANREAYVGMFGANMLSAEIDFLRQCDVWNV